MDQSSTAATEGPSREATTSSTVPSKSREVTIAPAAEVSKEGKGKAAVGVVAGGKTHKQPRQTKNGPVVDKEWKDIKLAYDIDRLKKDGTRTMHEARKVATFDLRALLRKSFSLLSFSFFLFLFRLN